MALILRYVVSPNPLVHSPNLSNAFCCIFALRSIQFYGTYEYTRTIGLYRASRGMSGMILIDQQSSADRIWPNKLTPFRSDSPFHQKPFYHHICLQHTSAINLPVLVINYSNTPIMLLPLFCNWGRLFSKPFQHKFSHSRFPCLSRCKSSSINMHFLLAELTFLSLPWNCSLGSIPSSSCELFSMKQFVRLSSHISTCLKKLRRLLLCETLCDTSKLNKPTSLYLVCVSSSSRRRLNVLHKVIQHVISSLN